MYLALGSGQKKNPNLAKRKFELSIKWLREQDSNLRHGG